MKPLMVYDECSRCGDVFQDLREALIAAHQGWEEGRVLLCEMCSGIPNRRFQLCQFSLRPDYAISQPCPRCPGSMTRDEHGGLTCILCSRSPDGVIIGTNKEEADFKPDASEEIFPPTQLNLER